MKYSSLITKVTVLIAAVVLVGAAVWNRADAAGHGTVPDPAVDSPLATKAGEQTAVVAGASAVPRSV